MNYIKSKLTSWTVQTVFASAIIGAQALFVMHMLEFPLPLIIALMVAFILPVMANWLILKNHPSVHDLTQAFTPCLLFIFLFFEGILIWLDSDVFLGFIVAVSALSLALLLCREICRDASTDGATFYSRVLEHIMWSTAIPLLLIFITGVFHFIYYEWIA